MEDEANPSHRFAGCEWEDRGSVGVLEDGAHTPCALDFVVDEFELYGLGD